MDDRGGRRQSLPYRSYSAYLRERFGGRVHRIALDAGFGCPHRSKKRGAGGCTYCSPEGSGTGAFDQGLSLKEQMARGIERLRGQGVKGYIAYFQSFCNTAGTVSELERAYLEAVTIPGVVGISVGTRPDLVPDKVLRLLEELPRKKKKGPDLEVWLELGLQSANDKTLRRIGRGHDAACFDDAVRRADRHGLAVSAHVMIGLPGEDTPAMMATADHLGRLPVKGVKIHHLYIEEGTELARQYRRQPFETLSLETYLPLVIGFIRRLQPEVVIMRLAGRGDPRKLIAPKWSQSAGTVADRIAKAMIARGCRQGDLYGSGKKGRER